MGFQDGLYRITIQFFCVLSHTSLVWILLVHQLQSPLLHPPLPNDRCLVAAAYHLVLVFVLPIPHVSEQGGQQLLGRGQPGTVSLLLEKHTEEFWTRFSHLSPSLPFFTHVFWLSSTVMHITYPWFQSSWYETKHQSRIRKSMGIVGKIRKKIGCHWKEAQFEASSYFISRRLISKK